MPGYSWVAVRLFFLPARYRPFPASSSFFSSQPGYQPPPLGPLDLLKYSWGQFSSVGLSQYQNGAKGSEAKGVKNGSLGGGPQPPNCLFQLGFGYHLVFQLAFPPSLLKKCLVPVGCTAAH